MVHPEGTPDYPAISQFIKENPAWGQGVKVHYSEQQHRKCGYCESSLTDYGDVEHFRPKNAVFRLENAGREVEHLNNIEGRKYSEDWDSGYWWLAYDWENYLLACGRCNQQWKNALFPIRFGHRRRPRPGDERDKESYLLDPFGALPPEDHLEFSDVGGIRARDGSRHGSETIKVYGLDRPSCLTRRHEKAARTAEKIQQLLEADSPAEMAPILGDISTMGDERFVHAGMVRIMFVQATGWKWTQLTAWLAAN